MQDHSYRRAGSGILGAPYRLSFFLWRRSPRWFQSYFYKSSLAKGVKTACRNLLAKFARREDLYSREYYAYVDREAVRSAPAIAESVIAAFRPARIIDVGCGTGALLAEFRARGIPGVGLEYSQAALELCRQRNLEVFRFNIEETVQRDCGTFDAAICFEVAEHVAAEFADPLVNLLVRLSSRVIFTAATPGQGGGADHVNEQPHEYWVAKFEQRGYKLLHDLTGQWRDRWRQCDVAAFYADNIMVFETAASA